MNFTLKSVKNGCRVGCLVSLNPDTTVETPACMLYTKGGSAPYLGTDILKRLKNTPGILHIPLCHFGEFGEILEIFEQGVKKYTANEGFLLYTSLHDPVVEIAPGFNDKNSIAIWGRKGKTKMEPEKFCKLQESMRPDMYQVMCDCDTNRESTNKRLKKSYDNSLKFLDSCLEKHETNQVLKNVWLLGVAGGGYSKEERIRWAKELAKRPVSGYVLEGFHNGGPKLEHFSFQDVIPLIQASLEELQEDKPRLMPLIWTPDNVILGVEAGIDIFDSSFPYIVTERGGALDFKYQTASGQRDKVYILEVDGKRFKSDEIINATVQRQPARPFELDLNDKIYAEDQRPLVDGCTCYTCQTHSRGYIQHLLASSELLASILLMIHNFHHYFEFFAAIRDSLKEDTFDKLKEVIFKQRNYTT